MKVKKLKKMKTKMLRKSSSRKCVQLAYGQGWEFVFEKNGNERWASRIMHKKLLRLKGLLRNMSQTLPSEGFCDLES